VVEGQEQEMREMTLQPGGKLISNCSWMEQAHTDAVETEKGSN